MDTNHLIPARVSNLDFRGIDGHFYGIRWENRRPVLTATGYRNCFYHAQMRQLLMESCSGSVTVPMDLSATMAFQLLLKPWSYLPWTVSSKVHSVIDHVLFGTVATLDGVTSFSGSHFVFGHNTEVKLHRRLVRAQVATAKTWRPSLHRSASMASHTNRAVILREFLCHGAALLNELTFPLHSWKRQ